MEIYKGNTGVIYKGNTGERGWKVREYTGVGMEVCIPLREKWLLS